MPSEMRMRFSMRLHRRGRFIGASLVIDGFIEQIDQGL
jgi:hypothetical protein